ncbi:MAG: DUF4124 domain-containing protein [Burkholderiales bacterium]
MNLGSKRSCALLALVLAASMTGAHAQTKKPSKLYKWVDEKGVTHYTETMPVEVKDKSSTEIDKRGRVLRKNEAAMTPEQIRQLEAGKEQRKFDEKKAEEQRRKDNALLNTYTNEAEIDGARDRAIAGASQTMQAIDLRLKTARTKLESAKRQMNELQKAGKPVPDAVVDEMWSEQRSVEKIGKELTAKQNEIDNLKLKYESDRARYRELTAANKK